MNGLSALFFGDLSGGATDTFAPYAATDTAPLSRKLWARWLELEATWTPGNEYDWVDEFAEILGLRPWFAWIPDESFSGLHLMCLMFAGFKHIAPGDDPQIDLEEPFFAALEEFNRRANGD